MKAQIANFVNTKKEAAVASGKAYATAKGKEIGHNTLHAVLSNPKVSAKINEVDDAALDFMINKLDKVEKSFGKVNNKVEGFVNKATRILLTAIIAVSAVMAIGGIAASFLTGNFFWMILPAFAISAVAVSLVSMIDPAKAEDVLENVVAPLEDVKHEAEIMVAKLTHPEISTAEALAPVLKAA